MKISVLITQILILTFFVACSNKRGPASDKRSRISIIFDIDYTIVAPSTSKKDSHTVTVEGETYRVNDGVVEMIEKLSKRDNVDIYFFSGGGESRNLELLKQIKSDQGKSLLSYTTEVYSFNDLTQVATEGRFSKRYKKNLAPLGFDLRNTILVDDNELFAVPGQEENMLWLGKTYHHVEDYNKITSLKNLGNLEAEYFPTNPDAWFLARNKLKYVDALLDAALDAEDERKGSFLHFIHTKKNEYIPYKEVRNSHFDNLLTQKPNRGCTSLVLSFP